VDVDLRIGADIVDGCAKRATAEDARSLRTFAAALRMGGAEGVEAALDDELDALARRFPDRRLATTYDSVLPLWVDRERARFSAWYEFFPRSTDRGGHGTFATSLERLEYAAAMGFDIAYLPPVHPIGTRFRKGPNNDPNGTPEAIGSPWAIGGDLGGHTAFHPDLGTVEEFRALVRRGRELGCEIALDIAYQCSPDHPWVREHPEWFRQRPDGTIQYAENPPKRYQDIYPLDFETPDWKGLWEALAGVVRHWIAEGVRVFRVDNPHTKAFPFWEWMIADVRSEHPDVIFLSEAFTRPKVMYRLAKLGFTQSYTYFAWRQEKWELEEYLSELSQPPVSDLFRPSFWPNTPDILTEQLQDGGRPTFIARLVLAATMSSSYGIYGPAFELVENVAVKPGSEEYLDSEKYQVREWNVARPDSLRPIITRLNAVRREQPALQHTRGVTFCQIDNDRLIAYVKATDDLESIVLTVVNLDPDYTQAGWVQVPLDALGIAPDHEYVLHDVLLDARYTWRAEWNYVELSPKVMPAHVFVLHRRRRDEHEHPTYA
jgi:starch synthase (maltosyl-transferring)